MLEYSTGNNIVDTMATIQLSGNIIPQIWYKQIVRDNGKPHLLAISILADVVYWYRPTEIRDPGSGQFTGFRKKFAGDYLQRSYQQIADQFGESKRTVTDAIVRLEKLGVLERVFRTINVNGTLFNNVLYLKLNPEKLYEITYPSEEETEEPEQEINNPEETIPPIPDTPPLTKFRERGHIILGEGSQNLGTRNTKNTNKITQISSSSKEEPEPEKEDDDDRGLKEVLNYAAAINTYSPDLVQQIFSEIKNDPRLREDMTEELFMRICENIQYYSNDIVNLKAYILRCLENLVAGKEMSEAIRRDRARGQPPGTNKNQFNSFEQQNQYDFKELEKELISNN